MACRPSAQYHKCRDCNTYHQQGGPAKGCLSGSVGYVVCLSSKAVWPAQADRKSMLENTRCNTYVCQCPMPGQDDADCTTWLQHARPHETVRMLLYMCGSELAALVGQTVPRTLWMIFICAHIKRYTYMIFTFFKK